MENFKMKVVPKVMWIIPKPIQKICLIKKAIKHETKKNEATRTYEIKYSKVKWTVPYNKITK